MVGRQPVGRPLGRKFQLAGGDQVVHEKDDRAFELAHLVEQGHIPGRRAVDFLEQVLISARTRPYSGWLGVFAARFRRQMN